MALKEVEMQELFRYISCCFDFDPKIPVKCIYSVYYLLYCYLDCRMVQDLISTLFKSI